MGIKLPNGFEIYINVFGMICLATIITGIRKTIEICAERSEEDD